MATYNGEKFIRQQLDSILGQLGSTDELVISDDGSTDETKSIIAEYRDPRIRLLDNKQFKSPMYNFENALKYAAGDFIFLADQDDVWSEVKVETMLTLLERYDLVISDCEVIGDNHELLAPSFFDLVGAGPGRLKNLYFNTYLGCCMAFRRSVLDLALPFPRNPNIGMHDIWIGFLAELNFSPIFYPEKLVRYRRHSGNASTTGGASGNSLTRKLLLRVTLLYYAIKRTWFDQPNLSTIGETHASSNSP